jgi:hypothetical protein
VLPNPYLTVLDLTHLNEKGEKLDNLDARDRTKLKIG